jgi:hypothetical protein
MAQAILCFLGNQMKFQSGVLAISTHKTEQGYEKEREKDGEEQSSTVGGKELQILQGDEPDMTQLSHSFLSTPR